MTRPGSRPDRIGRLLSGLARQLELPFFGGQAPLARDDPTPGPSPTPKIRHKPKPLPDGTTLRQVRLSASKLDYALRRTRRKTIGFSISGEGLTISAPRWVGVGQIDDAIREREGWVLTKLADMRRHQASIPRVRWEDGGTLPYLGEPITLRVASHAVVSGVGADAGGPRAAATNASPTSPSRSGRRNSASFEFDTRTLTLTLPPGASPTQIKDRVEAWLQNEARTLFRERLAHYEAQLAVRHQVLRLSSAKTRWGSCSADGRILLNWRLIHFPLSSIDYVVAHELAHLKEMNHGPRFWATVATMLPDFESAREHVRNPPPELLPTL